jgi:hypothetical protein
MSRVIVDTLEATPHMPPLFSGEDVSGRKRGDEPQVSKSCP